MKTATTALKDLLITGNFVRCDLYTFTLASGAVYRYTNADRLMSWGGNSYTIGIKIDDEGVSIKCGLSYDAVTITMGANPTDTIGGVNFFALIRSNGLDGAKISIDRLYLPDWSSAPTGIINRFTGRFSSIKELTRAGATIEAAPWTELLNVNMPSEVYQPSCYQLFDARCGLNRASFAISGTIGIGSTKTQLVTGLSQAADWFTLGKIVFTSGANNGVSATIKTHAAGGGLTLVTPLPSAPANGDTFTAYPGCDLKQSTCKNKFNNLSRFSGKPYIPVPETSL